MSISRKNEYYFRRSFNHIDQSVSKQIVHRDMTTKQHKRILEPNFVGMQIVKDYYLQKNKWQKLRNQIKNMSIDNLCTKDYRLGSSPKKKQPIQQIKKDQIQQPVKMGLENSQNYKAQKNKKEISTHRQTDRSIQKVYNSKSINPCYHHTYKLTKSNKSNKLDQNQDKLSDISSRTILFRKTQIQGNKFYLIELSTAFQRLIFIVYLMGQKNNKLRLILSKLHSKKILEEYKGRQSQIVEQIKIGRDCLSLKRPLAELNEGPQIKRQKTGSQNSKKRIVSSRRPKSEVKPRKSQTKINEEHQIQLNEPKQSQIRNEDIMENKHLKVSEIIEEMEQMDNKKSTIKEEDFNLSVSKVQQQIIKPIQIVEITHSIEIESVQLI